MFGTIIYEDSDPNGEEILSKERIHTQHYDQPKKIFY